MTRRRLSLYFLLYLFATAVGALLAFLAGMSVGARAAFPATAVAELRDRANHVDTTELIWSCDSFGGAPGLRAQMYERVCGDGAQRQRRRNSPLRRAVAQSIAETALLGAGPPSSRPRDFFAPAPDGAFSAAAPGTAADLLGPPSITGAPLDPFLVFAGGQPTQPIPDPGDPPIVAPLPGAAWLMAAGLIGLFGARRRRPSAGFQPPLGRG